MPFRHLVVTPARHSLGWRLSAAIAVLIGVVLVTFVWLAHRTLERTLVESGSARLVATIIFSAPKQKPGGPEKRGA